MEQKSIDFDSLEEKGSVTFLLNPTHFPSFNVLISRIRTPLFYIKKEA